MELFAENGFRAVTLPQIADRAGVAPRTLTVHFPAKEDMLFAADPFSLGALAEELATRNSQTSTLTAVRRWNDAMNATSGAEAGDARAFWRRRLLRSEAIRADPFLRAKGRASYVEYERLISEALASELGVRPESIAPRLTAATLMTGLREIYETYESPQSGSASATAQRHALVDQVFAYAEAGLAALRIPPAVVPPDGRTPLPGVGSAARIGDT